MPRQTDIRFRRGTAALWTSTNPVLNPGEPGIETDTDKVKYGDGVTAWNFLNYATGGGGVAIGTTAPTDTEATPLWWDSSTATMYIYYDGAWVEASAAVAGPQGPQGEQGLQGVQGTSGVISVTSPITNSGTTTEAVLGLNQSALTIAQSQVTNLTTDLAAKASLTGIETLTNKTLTSPALNGAANESWYWTGTGFAGHTFYVHTNGAIQWHGANATANGVLNITSASGVTLNSVLSGTKSVTISHIIQNGATAYYPTSIQVDGTTTGVTTRWSGGTAPSSGNANSFDIYTYVVTKIADATFYVFASVTKFA